LAAEVFAENGSGSVSILTALSGSQNAKLVRRRLKSAKQKKKPHQKRRGDREDLLRGFDEYIEGLKDIIKQMRYALRIALPEARSTHCEKTISVALKWAERGGEV